MNVRWFHDHLTGELLPRWLKAAPTPNGLYFPHLDRTWRRREPRSVTLVSQSRLIYNFATAYRLTVDDAYLDACRIGADALLRYFRTPNRGMWRWAVELNGEPADESLFLYGHAFVVFGLSHAYSTTGDGIYREAAEETAVAVLRSFRDDHGGFAPSLDTSGQDTGATRSQNPIMHLFEAFLALYVATGDGSHAANAAAVGDWVITRLLRDDGVIPELYDERWNELSQADGGRLDMGHQFEWAYLLSRAVELGIWQGEPADERVRVAHRLLDRAVALGYDAENGGVWSPASPEGKLLSRSKGWWEQCEAARAFIHHAVVRHRSDLLPLFEQTMAFCRHSLIDAEHGGWFMRLEADGSITNTDKGNVWKVDYHVVGLCDEVIRLASSSAGHGQPGAEQR